ncbi:MAG: hypothetical protein ABJL71_15610 [Cyclobacteriaceae bacterium]
MRGFFNVGGLNSNVVSEMAKNSKPSTGVNKIPFWNDFLKTVFIHVIPSYLNQVKYNYWYMDAYTAGVKG